MSPLASAQGRPLSFDRRDFFRLGSLAGASLLLPDAAEAASAARPVRPQYLLTGGATDDGVLVHSTLARTDAHAHVDLAVSDTAKFSTYQLTGVQRADKDSIVRHVVTGRRPDTEYYARLIAHGVPVGETIRFKTLPTGGNSWTRTIAVVSCMGNAASPDTTQLAWRDILDWRPDDIWHLGDWGYWGQQIAPHASYRRDLHHYLGSMRRLPVMRNALQSACLNVVTISDHELTADGDPKRGIHNSPESIRELKAFQALMPVREYGDYREPRRGRYYAFDIGDEVRVIVTDFRTPDRSNDKDPDGPHKTMFGATQLGWLLSSLDSRRVNLLVNETSWLGDPNQHGRARDKPWYYNNEQQIIAGYITSGGYKVAWIGGDRHYVGYLAGSGRVSNTLGGFPCYISSGMSRESNALQQGELMTWQYGAHPDPETEVCQYMRLTLSFDARRGQVSLAARGRAVLDTRLPKSQWTMDDIPGGVALDQWRV